MKKYLCIVMMWLGIAAAAQMQKADLGITYQALIFKPNGQELPGKDNARAVLANAAVCLKFSILDNKNQIEYQETIQTSTDKYGMVNLLIGKGYQIGGYASKFADIQWQNIGIKLRVELDAKGNCGAFVLLSEAAFATVPYALHDGLSLKEDTGNKQNSLVADPTNLKFPTVTAVNSGLESKEPSIAAGTAAQYFSGDKSWKTLNTEAVPDPTAYANLGTAADATQAAINTAINNKLGSLPDDANLVHIKGAETISGEKTFSSNVGVKTNAKPTVALEVGGTVKANAYMSPVQSFTGKQFAWDLSKGSNAHWKLVAGANNLSLTNMKAGMYGTIVLTNQGSSSLTFAGGQHKVIGGAKGVPALTMAPNAVDLMVFFYDGATFWWTLGTDYN